ncbi:Transcription factor [Malassezia cuniculi]|uniref:non-specific serine/threonine protein kinase n=1 Tax=Malassezia cuniculi TaxID=948313 RepID=A0AAF0EY63_9BASI|nr:Transcription factor [Malassezia cuniculi]
MSRAPKRAAKRESGDAQDGDHAQESQPRKKTSVRRKVNMACIYCRRSHMTCDENRPCRRCVKRDIGHLCRDEAASPASSASRTRTQRPQQQPRYSDITAIRPQATLHMAPRPDLLPDLGNQSLVLDPTHTHIHHAAHAHTRHHTHTFNPSDTIASLAMPTLTNGESPTPFGMSSSFASTSSQELALLPPSHANPDVPLAQQQLATRHDMNLTTAVAPGATQRPGQTDTSDGSLFHGTPLGGAGWLGLGGSAHQSVATGDSGGGGEFNTLSEFLESLDEGSWYLQKNAAQDAAQDAAQNSNEPLSFPYEHGLGRPARDPLAGDPTVSLVSPRERQEESQNTSYPSSLGGTKTERFLLTAADQTDGSRDERLRKVIQAKYEAGLLRPYNHVNGYARLNRWMEQNVSATSRRRILKPLSVFRPVFYNVAKNLTHFDLIYIEEAFERLLLDYDRVFSIQGVPACLWRRTGEIYKGNKEFAELAGVPIEALREGRLCIYELMAEESAVNYWEKFGAVSFDPSQKAVLTMCKLRTKNRSLLRAHTVAQQRDDATADAPAEGHGTEASTDNAQASQSKEEAAESHSSKAQLTEPSSDAQEGDTNATKSGTKSVPAFTIRRDKWNYVYRPAVTAPRNNQAPRQQQQRPATRLEREKKRSYNDPPAVGPWKLGKLIGQGASGRVRLAEHTRTHQAAAVKIIPKQLLFNSRMSLRDLTAKQDKFTLGIEREIVIMKLIEHPNLLGLWDVYETSKELYLVMEYVAGGELFDYLVARGRLGPDEARHFFRQLIFGVDYCHSFSICHRDLKPENLLLDGSKRMVKIADFGMAALQPSERMLETSCGSPHYASPEIVSGKSYDGTASDIWSCGIILFALLCGRLPFDDPNIQVLLSKVRTGRFEMPEHLESSVRNLIWRMLTVDPARRATMDEIMHHPWFTDNGRLSSSNPVHTEFGALGNEPINLADIDPDILGNLSTLWPECTHEHLIRMLLKPGHNWQKTFYHLLVMHRENHASDDEDDEDLEDLDAEDKSVLGDSGSSRAVKEDDPVVPTLTEPSQPQGRSPRTPSLPPSPVPPSTATLPPVAASPAPNPAPLPELNTAKASSATPPASIPSVPTPLSVNTNNTPPVLVSALEVPPSQHAPVSTISTNAPSAPPVVAPTPITPVTPQRTTLEVVSETPASPSPVREDPKLGLFLDNNSTIPPPQNTCASVVAFDDKPLLEPVIEEEPECLPVDMDDTIPSVHMASPTVTPQRPPSVQSPPDSRVRRKPVPSVDMNSVRESSISPPPTSPLADAMILDNLSKRREVTPSPRERESRFFPGVAGKALAMMRKPSLVSLGARSRSSSTQSEDKIIVQPAEVRHTVLSERLRSIAGTAKTDSVQEESVEAPVIIPGDGSPSSAAPRDKPVTEIVPVPQADARQSEPRVSHEATRQPVMVDSIRPVPHTPKEQARPLQPMEQPHIATTAIPAPVRAAVKAPLPTLAPVQTAVEAPAKAPSAAPSPALSSAPLQARSPATVTKAVPPSAAPAPQPAPTISVPAGPAPAPAPAPALAPAPAPAPPVAAAPTGTPAPAPAKLPPPISTQAPAATKTPVTAPPPLPRPTLVQAPAPAPVPIGPVLANRLSEAPPPRAAPRFSFPPQENMQFSSAAPRAVAAAMRNTSDTRHSSAGSDVLIRDFMREIADELDSLDAFGDSLSAAPWPERPRSVQAMVPDTPPTPSGAWVEPSRPRTSLDMAPAPKWHEPPRVPSSRPTVRSQFDDADEGSLVVSDAPTSSSVRDRASTPVYAAFARFPSVSSEPEEYVPQRVAPAPPRPASPSKVAGPRSARPSLGAQSAAPSIERPKSAQAREIPRIGVTERQMSIPAGRTPSIGVVERPKSALSQEIPRIGVTERPASSLSNERASHFSPRLESRPASAMTSYTRESAPTPTIRPSSAFSHVRPGSSLSRASGRPQSVMASYLSPESARDREPVQPTSTAVTPAHQLKRRRSLLDHFKRGEENAPVRPTSPGPLDVVSAKNSWFNGLLNRRSTQVLLSVENLTVTVESCQDLLGKLGATLTPSSRAHSSLPIYQQGTLSYVLERLQDPRDGTSVMCKPMRFRVEYTVLPVASGTVPAHQPQVPLAELAPTGRPQSRLDAKGVRPTSPAAPTFATSVTFTHDKGSVTTFKLFMTTLRRAWTCDART